jgi:uncharacterized membrane protein YfcA
MDTVNSFSAAAALHALLLVAIGAGVGAAGGLFGIGGALIVIPILSLVFGLDQQHAQGTALVMGLPITFVGLWRYAQRPAFDRRGAVVMALAAAPATLVGAYVALHLAGPSLRPAFAGFLMVLAVWLVVRTLLPAGRARPPLPHHLAWIAVLGGTGGLVSGTFSSGGAALAVPFLTMFFGYAQATAQGMSLGLIAPGAIISIVAYGIAGAIDWPTGIPLAIGGMLFIKQGVALAHRLPQRTLRLLFGALLVLSGFALLRHG